MTASSLAPTSLTSPARRILLNKVPEVTAVFWIVKILCTTVGETASDFLATNLDLGLTITTLITGALLAVILVAQFLSNRYRPALYWLAVVFVSVVGTEITDNLTDNFGVPLWATTLIFGGALVAVFTVWFGVERTLSIHSITTTRREAFYWSAILVTFALGTSAGDLTAERLALGYLPSALIFGGIILVIWFSHTVLKLNAVFAFWAAYILTRPLGASLGDFLAQARADGGLGLGTTVTSAVFLTVILFLVAYLAVTRDRGARLTRPLDA